MIFIWVLKVNLITFALVLHLLQGNYRYSMIGFKRNNYLCQFDIQSEVLKPKSNHNSNLQHSVHPKVQEFQQAFDFPFESHDVEARVTIFQGFLC